MDQLFYYIISFLGAIQGIMVALLFFFKKEKHPARYALGAYLFIFSLGLFEKYVETNFQGITGEAVLSFLAFSNFLYGPLLYLFVSFLTLKGPKFTPAHLLHLLPFVLGLSQNLVYIFSEVPLQEKDLQEFIFFELLVIQILTYNIFAIIRLNRHQQNMVQLYSNLKYKDLKWLRLWVLWITFIYVISFAITHALVFGWEEAGQWYILVQLLITCCIYGMSYRLLGYPGLFTFVIQGEPEDRPPLTAKYLRSGLRPEQASLYIRQIKAFMESQKPYLDADLNIYHLSEKLEISRHHLTQVINECLGRNFYELVNEYRIEEVKRLIFHPDYAHLTLSAIGLEAGFKSKSAFNSNFKSLTGLTPTQWKKKEGYPYKPAVKDVPA